jgi:hypothetical protein
MSTSEDRNDRSNSSPILAVEESEQRRRRRSRNRWRWLVTPIVLILTIIMLQKPDLSPGMRICWYVIGALAIIQAPFLVYGHYKDVQEEKSFKSPD